MLKINLEKPNEQDLKAIFSAGYSDKFEVFGHPLNEACVVSFNDDGEIEIHSQDYSLNADQIYDHLAFDAGVISESECYWYEEPATPQQEDDYECQTYQGYLSNRELDGRFEGNF